MEVRFRLSSEKNLCVREFTPGARGVLVLGGKCGTGSVAVGDDLVVAGQNVGSWGLENVRWC